MLVLSTLFAFLLSTFASDSVSAKIGLSFESGRDLPLLKLPYGTWRAHSYNDEADVYTFRNIRYAAPPIGKLRWAKPAPPSHAPGIQDGSYGHNCIPAPIPGNFDNPIFENITKNADEDCLFLDVYVPGMVLRKQKRSVPVVVWLHGGGYVTGSKDQAVNLGYYDGTGLIQRSDNNLIIVTINYRLGAFGFLAGEPLHGDGVFNAGLHDQRAAFQWVQSYIHLLGGNPNDVSAWGQSAGAGSIIYHLIAEGGALDPLFKKVLLQSPAFGTNANPQIYNERFEAFAAVAGCPGKGNRVLDCLRSANTSALAKANEEIFAGEASPVPDGSLIRSPAIAEYASGNTWPSITSLLTSHVLSEASLFLPSPPPPNPLEHIYGFIYGLLPSNPHQKSQTATLVDHYKATYANFPPHSLLLAVYTDLLFTCNLRSVLTAYPHANRWAMQYAYIDGIVNGSHGSDTPATWYSPSLQGYEEPLFARFQKYLTNFARTGDPNTDSKCRGDSGVGAYWPGVSERDLEGEVLGDVFNVTNWGFEGVEDGQMRRGACEVWKGVFLEALEASEGG
ncbi:Alpha/Beta hydrolase protein [Aspergillus karnatakaensis]|uniref:Alpha/Beta hydrolase protein n=1 Tax=Aspergillus karnatakaensis TaxID=1810916 RepID=UPI003CCDF79D